jgi:hypothetical protein
MPKKQPNKLANRCSDSGQPVEKQAPAAYFLSLELQNVRCFGEPPQSLDLSDGNGKPAQWTILLGNNGTGENDNPPGTCRLRINP